MIQVIEGIYRGPRPNSLEDIPGIKTVLSLESGWFELFHDEMYEEDQVDEAQGVKIIHVPMNAVGLPPSKKSLDQTLKILSDTSLYPLYVHCMQGVDRTGMVVAYYRCNEQHWSTDEAMKEMISCGFHFFRYSWWILYFLILRHFSTPS